jgi:hypothetical protein
VRFGIKDDFVALQGFRRREEQIKIFEVGKNAIGVIRSGIRFGLA